MANKKKKSGKSVVRIAAREASLKRRFRRHLRGLGFVKRKDGFSHAQAGSKDVVRALHSAHRDDKLRANAQFIKERTPDLLKHFAAGAAVDPTEIAPELERISSDTWQSDLFRLACRLSLGPLWLFRISDDGTAHEIVGHVVRPAQAYVVLTTNQPTGHSLIEPCTVECSGISAFRIEIPSNVSLQDIAWLQSLDLQVARTIHVWPAGLPGRNWDGEGRGEWLTTEAPCFAVVHDHPVDGYGRRAAHGQRSFG